MYICKKECCSSTIASERETVWVACKGLPQNIDQAARRQDQPHRGRVVFPSISNTHITYQYLLDIVLWNVFQTMSCRKIRPIGPNCKLLIEFLTEDANAQEGVQRNSQWVPPNLFDQTLCGWLEAIRMKYCFADISNFLNCKCKGGNYMTINIWSSKTQSML